MSRILSPTIVCILAVFIGAGSGLFFFQIGAVPIITQIREKAIRETAKAKPKDRGWEFWTIEIDNLAAELKGERERQRKESEMLQLRTERLAAERSDLERTRTELATLKDEISRRILDIQGDESKNLKLLARTYTNLTPSASVAIFRTMDEGTAAKILFMMKPDTLASIFEEMAKGGPDDSAKAAALSERLRWLRTQQQSAPETP